MKRYLSPLILLLIAVTSAIAQETTGSDDASGAIGVLVALACGCGGWVLAFLAWVGFVIWFYFDAKSRGVQNVVSIAVGIGVVGALISLLGLFSLPFTVIAFIIYLLMRPKEKLPPGTGV